MQCLGNLFVLGWVDVVFHLKKSFAKSINSEIEDILPHCSVVTDIQATWFKILANFLMQDDISISKHPGHEEREKTPSSTPMFTLLQARVPAVSTSGTT